MNLKGKNKTPYKVTDASSQIWSALYSFRSRKIQIEKDNLKLIDETIGLEYDAVYGRQGQLHWNRVNVYRGFKFKRPDLVDRKTWKLLDEQSGIYVPSKTKQGRKMQRFLDGDLKSSSLTELLSILGLESHEWVLGVMRECYFPYVEIVQDTTILLCLYIAMPPADPNIVEITWDEFNELC